MQIAKPSNQTITLGLAISSNGLDKLKVPSNHVNNKNILLHLNINFLVYNSIPEKV